MLSIVVAAVIAGAFAVWQFTNRAPNIPTVAMATADQSPQSKSLARDLLIKLANLQGNTADSIRLVELGDTGSGKPDLIFEVSAGRDARALSAGLVLLAGKDRAILWSQDFQQPSNKPADLQQQLAYTAARVLGCALEALAPNGQQLSQTVVKLYLNGCATLGQTYAYDTSQVIPIFAKVTEKAPRFESAWAKLLVAERDHFESLTLADQKAMAPLIRRRIDAARKVNPDLAEAYLSERVLVPGGDLIERMRLSDRAIAVDPNNIHVLSVRGGDLMDVGRVRDALDAARRASLVDPLSPAMRNGYIAALTYAGRTTNALEELERAERLWPGASTLIDARFRIGLRYGDPAEALKIMRSGAVPTGGIREYFLEARLNPTKANVDRAVTATRSALYREPYVITELIQTLGEFQREEELYPLLSNWQTPELASYIGSILFRPALTRFRQDPRFMTVAARLGLLTYWQKSGKWPDFCFESDLPYDCEAEGAKIAA